MSEKWSDGEGRPAANPTALRPIMKAEVWTPFGGTVGKSYFVKSLPEPMMVNQRVATIKVSSEVESRFIDTLIRSEITQKVIRDAKNSTNDNISMGYIKGFAVPLPPLAEQKRIVAKVDELMALCDRLEAQQQERDTRRSALARASLARFAEAPTPANLHHLFHPSYTIPPADLRKSILTLAVQGKLVASVPGEGTGHDILKSAEVSETPVENAPCLPDHWLWAPLRTVTTLMNAGWSPACKPEPADKGSWGVLKTTAVQPLQYQEIQNKTLPNSLKPRPGNEVFDGDILFTRAGPMNRVGILCVARPTRPKLMLSDKIIRVHLIPGLDPDFAALSMTAGYSSDFIEVLKSGMAASQVNISQPKLRSVPIPIPPLAEQRRIVAKVDQLMALVDELETQLAASCATAKNLLQALVAELTAPNLPA
jgi:type I restriction enzyme S subunit